MIRLVFQSGTGYGLAEFYPDEQYRGHSFMKYRKAEQLVLAAILCCALAGCRNTRDPFSSPGTIGYQRNQAVLHDPFPSDQLGPPMMDRPRGFDLPLSEVVDSQGSPFAKRGGRVKKYNGF